MSRTRSGSEREPENEHEPRLPTEVLEAIDSIADGETATKDEIESVLKF